MEYDITLNAATRHVKGKEAAKKIRREGNIPAVFYGRGREARSLVINYRELKKVLFSGTGVQTLFKLRIDDGGQAEEKVVTIKEYQVDPLKKTMIHADFLEVDVNQPLEIEVPLVLKGKPIGVELGGMLQQIRRMVMVSALPKDIPENIEADVSELQAGGALHVEDVVPPEGVKMVYDVNFTLATVIAPRGSKSEDEEEGEGEDVEAETESAEE